MHILQITICFKRRAAYTKGCYSQNMVRCLGRISHYAIRKMMCNCEGHIYVLTCTMCSSFKKIYCTLQGGSGRELGLVMLVFLVVCVFVVLVSCFFCFLDFGFVQPLQKNQAEIVNGCKAVREPSQMQWLQR